MDNDSKPSNDSTKSSDVLESSLSKTDNILLDTEIKQKLKRSLLSGEDFKLYLLFKFGTYSKAANVVGFTEARIFQIVSGYSVPQSPDLIKKLSEKWEIDIVVLSALFERLRRGGK